MRLWSIHPRYLDSKGLVALWREALLAQAVLLGKTKGYKQHPQLIRFKSCSNPIGAIGKYLYLVYEEALIRGYSFDNMKISSIDSSQMINVTNGQVDFEVKHLLSKLRKRDRRQFTVVRAEKDIVVSGIFYVINGDVETWEIIT